MRGALPARRLLSGGLVLLTGLAVMLEARGYGLGTVARMGPGFFPTVLGGAMAVVGVLIAAIPDTAAAHDAAPHRAPDWRGWACICGGVLLFLLLGERFGLGPATFACVFVAAWGDRAATWRSSFALAIAAVAVAAVLFSWLLRFQLPLLRW